MSTIDDLIKQAMMSGIKTDSKLENELESAANMAMTFVKSFEKAGFSRMESILIFVELTRPDARR